MIIYLDANVVIYSVERDPVWKAKVEQRLSAADAASDRLACSEAVRFECLVGPLRNGDAHARREYDRFFAAASLVLISITPAIWERAAGIRAAYSFQPLDSVHIAAAIEGGCGLFLTNDARLAKCTEIPVEVIS